MKKTSFYCELCDGEYTDLYGIKKHKGLIVIDKNEADKHLCYDCIESVHQIRTSQWEAFNKEDSEIEEEPKAREPVVSMATRSRRVSEYKADNYKKNEQYFKRIGMEYSSYNNDRQWNFSFNFGFVSFYPTTNKWFYKNQTFYGDAKTLHRWSVKKERNHIA